MTCSFEVLHRNSIPNPKEKVLIYLFENRNMLGIGEAYTLHNMLIDAVIRLKLDNLLPEHYW